jgi:phosphoserine phosphatase
LLAAWQTDPEAIICADLPGDEAQAEGLIMESVFALHPLAIADALRDRHPPFHFASDETFDGWRCCRQRDAVGERGDDAASRRQMPRVERTRIMRGHARFDDNMPLTQTSPGLSVRDDVAPRELSSFRLIAFDMDSTLINIECVDEIAEVAGRRAEVAAITEAAMRGEIADYKESLRKRVALLEGVPFSALETVYRERLQLNPGAQTLVQACQRAGLKTLLVSGGFSFFTDRVRDRLQLDFTRSNELGVADGKLTGRLVDQPWGDICDGAEKRRVLLETCARIGCMPRQAIVIGDGANDLPMMAEAGLSVAYHAKPLVREQTMVSIDQGGLDRLLEVVHPT